VRYPRLKTESCPACGALLRYSAEDILGDSDIRIVSEIRPPQVELAKTIEDAIIQDKNAMTEAGTGTGKSLALLVPAILAGKRVLISTATTLLQHQYMTKDLPFLLAHLSELGCNFRFAVAKGRSHYLCKARLQIYAKKHGVSEEFRKWAVASEFGDKLELGQDVPPYWGRVNAEDCSGAARCMLAGDCGLVVARTLVANADVVVANHAIVGYDMRYNRRILPKHNYYIIDEAHQAAEYYRKAFAATFSENAISLAIHYLEGEAKALPPGEKFDSLVTLLRKENKSFFAKFPKKHDGSFDMLNGADFVSFLAALSSTIGELMAPYARELKARNLKRIKDTEYAAHAADIVDTKCGADDSDEDNAGRIDYLRDIPFEVILTAAKKFQRIHNSLVAICDSVSDKTGDDPHILYLQYPRTTKQGREVVYAPIFVSKILRNNLFPFTRVAASSATLTIGGQFEHFMEETGFSADALTYVTASPFDYAHRALLYCSKNVPIHPARDGVSPQLMEQKLGEYYEAMTDEIVNLTKASSGYAFVLFTNRVEMEEVAKRLKKESDFPVRMQEEGVSPGDLEKWFRKTKHPILCGLKSFWEGVSVEGDQLRLVIITKAPFPIQGDPIYQARKKILERRYGNNWYKRFKKLDVPAMITDVKQGTGRLIRTNMDYGVAAILDRKVSNQANKPGSYASLLINSLPFTLITASLSDVNRFLRQFEQAEKQRKKKEHP